MAPPSTASSSASLSRRSAPVPNAPWKAKTTGSGVPGGESGTTSTPPWGAHPSAARSSTPVGPAGAAQPGTGEARDEHAAVGWVEAQRSEGPSRVGLGARGAGGEDEEGGQDVADHRGRSS